MSGPKEDIKLKTAYNEAVKKYANRVCRFVDKMLQDENYAQDITQEAYIKLWTNRHSVNFEKARSWLFTTAYRLTIDYIRAQEGASRKHAAIAIEQTTELSNPDIKTVLNKTLNQLPEIQKSILLLRDYEGYNYEEIGEMLSLSESQVKVYLFRARKKMKQYIGDVEKVI